MQVDSEKGQIFFLLNRSIFDHSNMKNCKIVLLSFFIYQDGDKDSVCFTIVYDLERSDRTLHGGLIFVSCN